MRGGGQPVHAFKAGEHCVPYIRCAELLAVV